MLHIPLLAATNDHSHHQTQPINLIDNVTESLDELKNFANVKSIFVCKLSPCSDISRVNQEVCEFNQLLLNKFSNSNFVFIVDTVPVERRYFIKMEFISECHAVSAYENHPILSGENARGGVALLWKCSINDWVTPLEDITSDRIVKIRLDLLKCDPLFILGVCLLVTSAKHALDNCLEYLHCL